MSRPLRLLAVLISLTGLLWAGASIVGPRATAAQVTVQLTTTPTTIGTPGYLPLVFKEWPPALTPDPRTPTPTRTLSPFNFTKTSDSPAYLPNFANSNGCAWLGISGQVFDLERKGALGLIVRVTGSNGFDASTITGSFQKYGPSGYEVTLGIAPVDGTDWYIQLQNGSGQALSETINLQTFNDCQRNHMIFNFEQNH